MSACISFPTLILQNLHMRKFLSVGGLVYHPRSIGRLWFNRRNLAEFDLYVQFEFSYFSYKYSLFSFPQRYEF